VITFNGTNIPKLFGQDEAGKDRFRVIEITGRGPMSQNTTRLTVPGRPGSLYQSRVRPERVLGVRFFLKGQTLERLQTRLDTLNDLLNVDGPVPIIFDDQLDQTFFGILDGTPDWQEIQDKGIGTLTFVCPDPNKYGEEQTQTINDPTGTTEGADPIINYEGTAETYPVFTAQVLTPITMLQLVKDDRFMQVGEPVDVDTIEAPEYESILADNLSSFANWTALVGGSTLPDGIVGGAMTTAKNASGQAFAFTPSSYGTNANGWVGPAVKRALSEAVQDFRVAINMSVLNKMSGVGKVAIFLADDADNIFAGLWMEDTTASVDLNHARVALFDSQLSKQFLIDTTGERFNVYNDFEGILRLERRGNQFFAYSAQVDQTTGAHSARDTAQPFTDGDNLYSAPLSQVIIYIAKAKDYKTFTQTANDLSIAKINSLSANQVPYIAQSGDIITFDHAKSKLMLNGDPSLMRQIEIGSSFFNLTKGQNLIVVNPADSVYVEAAYREAKL